VEDTTSKGRKGDKSYLWYSKPLKVGSIWHWYISTANALHRGIQVVKALFYNTCTACTQRKRRLHQWLPHNN
jgi:hypothetical protein